MNYKVGIGAIENTVANRRAVALLQAALAIAWQEAEDCYAQAQQDLDEAQSLVPAEHAFQILICKCRAKLYRLQGNLVRAEETVVAGLQLSERVLGMTDNITRHMRLKLCRVYDCQSCLKKCRKHVELCTATLYQQAAERCRADGDVMGAAVMLADLGAHYDGVEYKTTRIVRQPIKARELYEQALPVLTEHGLKLVQPVRLASDVATWLGDLCNEQGDRPAAIAAYEKARSYLLAQRMQRSSEYAVVVRKLESPSVF